MSTITQLNWHQRYLATVAELHQARLDNDLLRKQLASAFPERDSLHLLITQMQSVLKSLQERKS